MAWKDNERKMYDLVKECIPSLSDINWSKDKYARFDAYNGLAICEFKYRKGRQYADTMIEKEKWQAMKDLNNGRVCAYIVQSAGKIYIFNLNKLAKEEYDYKWADRNCYKTSEFHNQAMNQQKVSKLVGYIQWDEAIYTIDVKTKEVTDNVRV